MQLATQHANPTTILSKAGPRRIPSKQLTTEDVTLYRYLPGYGYLNMSKTKSTLPINDAITQINKYKQISAFNKFAKKYGYDEILDLNISDSDLDVATKRMLHQHNTFYRGVRSSDETNSLAKQLGISEDEALKIAATTPRSGESHVFVSPTSNARIYGGGSVAEVRRPFVLGIDRSK